MPTKARRQGPGTPLRRRTKASTPLPSPQVEA